MYKYLFIGAGPATLSAIVNLPIVDRQRSVVIESGKAGDRRICPELKSKSCSSCFGEKCHVLNGLGGASANFGNKLCHFPASEGLFCASETSHSDNSFVPQALRARSSANKTVVHHPGVPNRKVYEVQVANLDEYTELMASLVKNVRSTTKILAETEIDQIVKLSSGGYRLHLMSGPEIDAEQVVIATGRSGHKALRKWLSSLDVDYSENSPDIGFRIELPTRALSDHYFYQDDPKFKFKYRGLGSARTFCTCKGGAVVPVKFGSGVYADGAFLRKDTGLTNLALMARTEEIFKIEILENWCARENFQNQNRLMRATFEISNLSMDQIKQCVMINAPLGPNPIYSRILENLVEQLFDRKKIDMLSKDIVGPTLMSIYGPSVDNFWPKVELTKSFETSSSGLFVLGDAAGYSRGIYQAMFAGKAWAQTRENVQNISIAR